jgi:hypothetical protein
LPQVSVAIPVTFPNMYGVNCLRCRSLNSAPAPAQYGTDQAAFPFAYCPSASAFPQYTVGRLLHYMFRGLPVLSSRYGLYARQVAWATLYTRAPTASSPPPLLRLLPGSVSEPVPGRDFHPQWTSAFHGARVIDITPIGGQELWFWSYNFVIVRYGRCPLECKGCASHKAKSFKAEVAIHFPGREGLTQPLVWVFPRLEVCPFCGSTHFTAPEEQLSLLRNGLPLPDTRARNRCAN